MKILGVAPLVASLILIPVSGIADPQDAVIEKYSSSRNLPDSVAYKMFLIIVDGLMNRTDDHQGHVMHAAFGINSDTVEGAIAAQERLDWFAASDNEAKREVEAMNLRALCPRDWSTMSYKEIQKARFVAEEAEYQIYDERYHVALEYLPPAESDVFRDYIVGVKERTGHVRFDPERYFGDDAESEAFEYQAAVCGRNANSEN